MDNMENMLDNVFEAQQEATQESQETQDKGKGAPEQSKDERAAQAAARRAREERDRQREQRAYQQARTEIAAIIKELGIEKADGSVIDTLEDLEEVAKDRREERLRSGKSTKEDIERVVDERLQKQSRISQEERAEVDRQLAEIRAMDPAMTDLPAILQSEAGPKFREYVGKGLDFLDAYKLSAEERLAGIAQNRQGRTGGKDHLTPTSSRGTGDAEVPADTMEMYRLLMPEMTDEQIRKAYNADRKKYGG